MVGVIKFNFIIFILIDCPKKMQIAHGYIDFENLNEDKGEVPVKCANGYSAKPHDMIFCRSDDSWSPVECKPKGRIVTVLLNIRSAIALTAPVYP